MRFLLITDPGKPGDPMPTPEALAKLAGMSQELAKSGVLVDTGGMEVEGTKVRATATDYTVLDGPYTESKELIAGYAIVDVNSKDEAIELSRRFYEVMGGGEGRIIQMFRQGETGPELG